MPALAVPVGTGRPGLAGVWFPRRRLTAARNPWEPALATVARPCGPVGRSQSGRRVEPYSPSGRCSQAPTSPLPYAARHRDRTDSGSPTRAPSSTSWHGPIWCGGSTMNTPLEPRRLGLAGVVRPKTCHADRLSDGAGRGRHFKPGLATPPGSGETPRRRGRAAPQERRCPRRHRPVSSSPSPARSRAGSQNRLSAAPVGKR
jgi:hypothetical protein